MKRFLALGALAMVVFASAVSAQPKVKYGLVIPRDNMFKRQGFWHPEQLINPAAVDTDAVASLLPGPVAGDTTITIAFAELTYPRGISLTLSGTNANVDVSTVTLTGINWARQSITEAIALTENMVDTTLYGAKAFLDVTSVAIEQQDGANVKISLGVSPLVGLPICSPVNGVMRALQGSTVDASPTVAVHATAIDQNTINFTTDPNGTNDYMFWMYIPPFASTTGVSLW